MTKDRSNDVSIETFISPCGNWIAQIEIDYNNHSVQMIWLEEQDREDPVED